MTLCRPPVHSCHPSVSRRGFTLLELCVVMFILLLFIGLAMPAIDSAFTEQRVRNDAHEISLMVKTAMQQSLDEHRPYFLSMAQPEVMLSSASPAAKNEAEDNATQADTPPDSPDFFVSYQLDSQNKILSPDPDKPRSWRPLPSITWIFQPGELCPLPRLRLVRGTAWLEMNFNPLTGNTENEQSSFP